MTKVKLFLIESGKALELVRTHIAEVIRVNKEVAELVKPLSVRNVWRLKNSGTVSNVCFDGPVHKDFCKPDRKGLSHPKKGTEWAAKFAAQTGHESGSEMIANAFDIPLCINKLDEAGEQCGWRRIGYPLRECGFLYISAQGPYAMWVPDVPGEVAASQERGDIVAEPALSFKLEFPGCRPMLHEEWKVLGAQKELDEAKKKAVAA